MNSLPRMHRVVVFYIFQEVKLTLIVGLTALYDMHVGDSVVELKFSFKGGKLNDIINEILGPRIDRVGVAKSAIKFIFKNQDAKVFYWYSQTNRLRRSH